MKTHPGIGRFIFQLGVILSVFCCFTQADLSRRSNLSAEALAKADGHAAAVAPTQKRSELWRAKGAKAEERTLQNFVLKEYLDHDWSRELVFFALDESAGQADPEKLTLFDPDNREIPFQIIGGSIAAVLHTSNKNGKQIAFLVDLPARAEQTYKLIGRAPAEQPATDLEFDEKEDSLRLWNSRTGVEVPFSGGNFSNGPIASIRLQSGKWVGGSRLKTKRKIASYEAFVLARGPVFGEIECKYTFEGGKTWTIRFRVIAGEPVIVLSETFDLKDNSRWELLLHPGFSPNHVAFRYCYIPLAKELSGTSAATRLTFEKPATPLVLHAWLPWSNPVNVSFLGLFRAEKGVRYIHEKKAGGPVRITMPGDQAALEIQEDEGKELITEIDLSAELGLDEDEGKEPVVEDVLFAAAGHAGVWARPGENGQKKALPLKTGPDGQVYFAVQLAGPAREWILGASTVTNTVMPDNDLAEPQQYMIKYCETSLQEVLDMTLEWGPQDNPEDYPRLYIHKEEIPAVRKRFAGPTPKKSQKILYWNFIFNPTPEVERKLRNRMLGKLASSLKTFTETLDGRSRMPAQTMSTHRTCMAIEHMLFAADLAMSRDLFTQAERDRIRAKMAFLAYKIASPHYYSLERNYRANPNMTTMRHATMGLLACMMPKHPMSKEWFDGGVKEIERQFAQWIGPNGGWLECPHYQTPVTDAFCLLRAALRAGFSDLLYDERWLKSILYLAKISTPPDPRFGNFRHFPAVGNTYRFETSCIFSIFAKLHRERNPEAAEVLQWTWIQHGRPLWRGIGGYGTINDFTEFLVADFEPKGPPNWKSELFPKSGAILRSGFPGERETQLYLLQGPFMEHYDYDRGSLTLWGKGRPLSLDWGKHGRAPDWEHSRMDVGFCGRITEFAAQDSADYLHSVQDAWHRQILFVKDSDPLGPNYFLLRDSTSGKGKADWWLWLYTEEDPILTNDVVRVKGQSDVDLDIWFASPRPSALPRKTRKELAEAKDADLNTTRNLLSDDVDFELELEEVPVKTPYIKTRKLTLDCETGCLEEINGKARSQFNWGRMPLTQKGLHLVVPRGEPVVCVLYPRLRDEKPVLFHELADGKGVRVESAAGTDYAFLALKSFAYQEGDVAFEGTAGAIQVRGKTVILTLGAAGQIRFRDKTLSADKMASREFVLE